jgi:predicted transcriptional regulator
MADRGKAVVMPETSRVQRWREEKRQQGLKAVTIWLTQEEESRLKDLALQWHCSPSALVQQALAQFSPQTPPSISSETETTQIRELIRAELTAMQAEQPPVTESVTEVVTDTLARDLPALVRQLVEGLALEALGLPVTDTNGSVAVTGPLDLPVSDIPYGSVTETETPEEAPEPRQTGRTRGEMRQRIMDLLQKHPKGLSAEQIRAYIQPAKPLGDTLQGMRKQQKVRTRGKGKDMRYFLA